jgi:hypothetical protein
MNCAVRGDLKLHPHNIEAEQAVLGAILLDNQALFKVLEVISPDEFYLPKHRRIFKAMITLLTEQNQVVDLVTLSDHLQHFGALEATGGSAYLTELATTVVTCTAIKAHSEIIKREAQRRAIIHCGDKLAEIGQRQTENLDKLIVDAQNAMMAAYRCGNGSGPDEHGPWSKTQTAKDFLSAVDPDVPMLFPCLLARGSITECFSPRGIGKTHAGHWLAVTLAKQGKRVLLLDRDNSRREVKRRLKAWGADGILHLRVLTRDKVPPLTDAEKWRTFPFQDYDVVVIDSLESSTEGCGEQDSAKPSRAIAPLLDIAHRENGPAILILGNTIKSGAHSRGSGVVEDRADVAFEVRDATALTPSGTKDWWLELPAAGAEAWANRASRRKRRDTYRLAFIASKYRIGEEPDPFIWEITMPDTGEPWTARDVTADVVKAGEDARTAADTERRATVDRAELALADQVRQRVEAGDPMLSDKDAIPYLVHDHDLTRKDAQQLIEHQGGILWDRVPGQGKGHPKILVPVGYKLNTAAEMPGEERPHRASPGSEPISAECMDTGRRKSGQTEAASNAGGTAPLFPPPSQVIHPSEPSTEWEEVADEC